MFNIVLFICMIQKLFLWLRLMEYFQHSIGILTNSLKGRHLASNIIGKFSTLRITIALIRIMVEDLRLFLGLSTYLFRNVLIAEYIFRLTCRTRMTGCHWGWRLP